MNTQFKAGDRVEVHALTKNTILNGKLGTVSGESNTEGDPFAKLDDGRVLCFDNNNLRLIEPPNPAHEFKVGDRVWFHGAIAGVKRFYSLPTLVLVVESGTSILVEFPCDSQGERIQLFVNKGQLSHDSPQPQQTNQTKEETMKPYAVIYQSLSNQSESNIQSRHTTEAEAKEAAEVLVSAQRADLTTKKYFSISILNTKTGELVGSVTDAPPVVDWKAGK